MKHRTRIYFSAEQRADIWDRWQRGESMSSIGRLFERESSSIYPILAAQWWDSPSQENTITIRPEPVGTRRDFPWGSQPSVYSLHSSSVEAIRPPRSVVKFTRNGGSDGYRASSADQAAWDRAHRPKPCKLARHRSLANVVAAKLKQQWSPQQIAGWLKRTYPDSEHERVSHETIYRSLYIQARGVLKKELQACLRTKRAIRRSKHASLKRQGLGENHECRLD